MNSTKSILALLNPWSVLQAEWMIHSQIYSSQCKPTTVYKKRHLVSPWSKELDGKVIVQRVEEYLKANNLIVPWDKTQQSEQELTELRKWVESGFVRRPSIQVEGGQKEKEYWEGVLDKMLKEISPQDIELPVRATDQYILQLPSGESIDPRSKEDLAKLTTWLKKQFPTSQTSQETAR